MDPDSLTLMVFLKKKMKKLILEKATDDTFFKNLFQHVELMVPIIGFNPLSLSDTEHGWAQGSNTVYSVIHGLTGTSIELQPCLGMSWYDLDSNVARICRNKARIYSIKQGLSWFEHDLQNDFHTIVVPFQVRSSTVCFGLVQ